MTACKATREWNTPPFQAALGQLGKEALDGVDPRGGGWREVKGEATMPPEPIDDLWMLVSGVVVEHDMDLFARRHLGLDGVQETNELLMPVALHAPADDAAFQHIQRGKQSRGAVPFVVVGHGAAATLLQR